MYDFSLRVLCFDNGLFCIHTTFDCIVICVLCTSCMKNIALQSKAIHSLIILHSSGDPIGQMVAQLPGRNWTSRGKVGQTKTCPHVENASPPRSAPRKSFAANFSSLIQHAIEHARLRRVSLLLHCMFYYYCSVTI